MAGKYYWLKERHNPQFEKPYYTACGSITVKKARKMEESLYGCNAMYRFDTEEDYNNKLKELRQDGFQVFTR